MKIKIEFTDAERDNLVERCVKRAMSQEKALTNQEIINIVIQEVIDLIVS